MLRHFQRAAMVTVLVVLAACTSLGVPTPENFSERVAAALTTTTTVRQTATTLLNSQIISSGDAENVLKQTDNAREGIEVARALRNVSPGAAEDKLTATLVILRALEKYLADRQQAGAP